MAPGTRYHKRKGPILGVMEALLSTIETAEGLVRRFRPLAVRVVAVLALAVGLVPAFIVGRWDRPAVGVLTAALAALLYALVARLFSAGGGQARAARVGRWTLAGLIAAMEILGAMYLWALDGGFTSAAAAVLLVPVAFAAARGTGLDAVLASALSAAVVGLGGLLSGGGWPALAYAGAAGGAGLLVGLTFGSLRRVSLDFAALYETGRALSSSLRLEDLLPLLLDIAMTDLDADAGAVFLVDRETEGYELAAARGLKPGRTVRSKDVERSVCDWAVRHKGPCLRTEDLDSDPLLEHFGGPWGAAIAVPLITGGGPVGVIVAAVRQRHTLSEDSVRFMEALAAQAATAVENAMLYRQTAYWAIRDGLTGLYNYRHFAERLEIELARAARYQTPLSLLVIDVDRFKNVNDDYGHLVGDEVLRALSERLVHATRESDLVARYGGEEFAVVLPETDYEGAAMAAEKLRTSVGGSPLVTLGPDRSAIGVTVSIGFATYPTTSAAEHIVSQADEALYDAKSRRNCVCSVRGRLAEGPRPQ